jgi:hypothetical protein
MASTTIAVVIMIARAALYQAVYRLALWVDRPAMPNGRVFYEHRTKNRRHIKHMPRRLTTH